MLAPCRRVWRLWTVLLSISTLSIVLLWHNHVEEVATPLESDRDDWVGVRYSHFLFTMADRREQMLQLTALIQQRRVADWEFLVLPTAKRLGRDQREYIDRRGVHVVVGHYMGDVSSAQSPPNLTDELLNTNMFDAKPNEGKNGQPVMIPSHDLVKMQHLFHINRFNLMASDRIPLNRSLPDVRKKRCQNKNKDVSGLPTTTIIIVFHNEAWSTLLRTVHSVINRSPHSLLKEILLVDDASTRTFLREPLDEHVTNLQVPTRVLRTKERVGLIRARLMGAREAQGQILTFLDAHCECTTGWLESLIVRIAEDRTRVVCPVIDIINDDTFAYVRSFELHWGAFNWELHFRWYTLGGGEINRRKQDITEPFRTPAMAGGLFAMDKNYFFELGAYDDQMEIWGGENLELSFRVWQCGGSIEIAPCSHVGHLFRKSSPYTFPGGVGEVLYSNLARVALVWMDDWKEFYFKFNPAAQRVRDRQSVRSRLELRNRLKCKSFEWYLDNIWPQHFMPKDDRFFGRIRSRQSGGCLQKPVGKGSLNQPMGSATIASCATDLNLQQMFVMTPAGAVMTDESVCLDAPERDHATRHPKVRIMACSGLGRQKWNYDDKTYAMQHESSGMCLSLPEASSSGKDEGLVLQTCTGHITQQWQLESLPWK